MPPNAITEQRSLPAVHIRVSPDMAVNELEKVCRDKGGQFEQFMMFNKEIALVIYSSDWKALQVLLITNKIQIIFTKQQHLTKKY